MTLFEYRRSFYFWTIVSTMWTLFNFLVIGVMGSVTGQIGNWPFPYVMILISTFTIIDSMTWSWFYINMWQYTSHIYSGTLSGFLVKPIDTQFLMMTQDNSFNNIPRFFLGVAGLVGTIWWYQISITPLQLLLYCLVLPVGMMFLYFVWFILATLAFWVERFNNIHDLLPGLRQIYQMPRTIYPKWLFFVVSVLFPVALVTAAPVELLISLNSWPWALYLFAMTFFMAAVARRFFLYSVKRFSGVGN